jgi:hypothetical protein
VIEEKAEIGERQSLHSSGTLLVRHYRLQEFFGDLTKFVIPGKVPHVGFALVFAMQQLLELHMHEMRLVFQIGFKWKLNEIVKIATGFAELCDHAFVDNRLSDFRFFQQRAIYFF